MTTETAIEKPAAKRKTQTLKDLLVANKDKIQSVAGRNFDGERMARLTAMLCSRDTALSECTPISVLSAVMDAASLRLEIGGPLAQSYLVPYKNSSKGTTEAHW